MTSLSESIIMISAVANPLVGFGYTVTSIPSCLNRCDAQFSLSENGADGYGIAHESDDAYRFPARRTRAGASVEVFGLRALYLTLLTAERGDLIPELGMGSEHAVIAVTVNAVHPGQSDPFESAVHPRRTTTIRERLGPRW